MERDDRLIRLVLEKAAALPLNYYWEPNEKEYQIDGYTREAITYHVNMCHEMGWIMQEGSNDNIYQLSYSGHDALRAMRKGMTP